MADTGVGMERGIGMKTAVGDWGGDLSTIGTV